jgi:hypothetical protein
VFRPAAELRGFFSVCSLLCLGGIIYGWFHKGHRDLVISLLRPAILWTPIAISEYLRHKKITVSNEGIISTNWLGSRSAQWAGVKRVDQGRRSFVIETTSGPISAGWTAPKERETLLRLVIERAKLTRVDPSRYGLIAQYVPRAQDIGFMPHAKRREQMKDEG